MNKATITIELVNGRLNVTGDIGDKILCLGMLEMAKALIQNYTNKNDIVSPTNGQVLQLGKNG